MFEHFQQTQERWNVFCKINSDFDPFMYNRDGKNSPSDFGGR